MNKRFFLFIVLVIVFFNGPLFSQEPFEVNVLTSNGYLLGSEFVITCGVVHMTEDDLLEPRSFRVSYDPSVVEVDTSKGLNGVDIGTDYLSLSVDISSPGEITIKIELYQHITPINIHCKTLDPGISPITVEADPDIYTIRNAVAAVFEFYGDVNIDSVIDIVDALLVAQFYVGMPVDPFVQEAGNVNCDDTTDIVDALLIAQYYVGLIPEFPLCEDVPTPTPLSTTISTPDPTPRPLLKGDINQDGVIDIIDCLLITQYLAGSGSDPLPLEIADMNGDGIIDEKDQQLICYPLIILND
ncbi:MAG: dockerin type I repeat-containing protein [Spirochaetales bacterium]|nr:dockerin type I repeat-containing protein [Spirochaetales bacterium]